MASDDTLLVVAMAGVVLEWSQAAQSLFGRAASEVVGRPVAALIAGAAGADEYAGLPFDRAVPDRDRALELASRTALHIENARRYTREHTIALTLHRQLLPQHPRRP
ncbi:PAS domain-containing protein [Streptomyces sp. NPDC054919]